jgi:hypothetical protein
MYEYASQVNKKCCTNMRWALREVLYDMSTSQAGWYSHPFQYERNCTQEVDEAVTSNLCLILYLTFSRYACLSTTSITLAQIEDVRVDSVSCNIVHSLLQQITPRSSSPVPV